MSAAKNIPRPLLICCLFLCEGDSGTQGRTVTEVSQGAALALLFACHGDFAAN